MSMMRRYFIFLFFLILSVFGDHTGGARAGVVFFDTATTAHTPVYLKVLTRGILFPQGGRLVDIYAEDRMIGKILSGGDGYGFMKITPQEAGLKTFRARLDGDSDSACLLVLKPTDRTLLFEIEVLARTFFSMSAGSDTQKALNTLSKKFKLIYLTRWVGLSVARKIIAKEEYPPSVVLKWQGPELLEDLKSRHITVTAIIGSADTISGADDVPHRFTFEKTEDETYVEDWQDIIKRLQ